MRRDGSHSDERWRTRGPFIAVLALALSAWGFWTWRQDPTDGTVAQLQQELRDRLAKAEDFSIADRLATREMIQQRTAGMTPEQQAAFRKAMAPLMMAVFEKQIDRFLALPPEEQRRELDKRIDELESARTKFGQGKLPAGQPGPPPFVTGGKGGDPRKAMLDMTTPEFRAKFETALDMFNNRRQERGLEPVGPGRG